MSSVKPEIRFSEERICAGKSLQMSFANNKTAELWKSFGPFADKIQNRKTKELLSLQIYPDIHFFSNFNPSAEYTKWALAEIISIENKPDGLELLVVPEGLYAVFHYKGNPQAGAPFFKYIFGEWLPSSEYDLDHRPHFEVLGERYKNNSDDSEEEIWIPIKKRTQ